MVDKIGAAGLDPDYIQTTADTQNTFLGNIAHTEKAFTLSSGAITPTRDRIAVTSESGATDNLDQIVTTNLGANTVLLLTATSGDTITVRDAQGAAGQIHMIDNADFEMSGDEALCVERRGADWYELWRSTAPTQVFSASFVSSEQTLTAGGLLTLAHGLSAVPLLIQGHMVCKTTDAGYAADDTVIVTFDSGSTATANSYGWACYFDSTNVYIRMGSVANFPILANKGTGVQDAGLTLANWKLVVRAFA